MLAAKTDEAEAVPPPPAAAAIGGGGAKPRPRKRCSTEGCTTPAQKHGLCERHGAYGTCTAQDCTTFAIKRGLCWKHGAFGQCTEAGCPTNAYNRVGQCWKHGGGNLGSCSVDGCITRAHARGICKVHGMKAGNQTCIYAGGGATCSSVAIKRNLCECFSPFPPPLVRCPPPGKTGTTVVVGLQRLDSWLDHMHTRTYPRYAPSLSPLSRPSLYSSGLTFR
jgi:hypothetical protein